MKIIYVLIWFLFLYKISFANDLIISNSCSYKWEFNQCKQANKNYIPRSIEDFVCISSTNNEAIMAQIILDIEFRKIDKEVENYLQNLEDDKDKYFWKNQDKNYLNAIDDIENYFSIYWKYWKKYIDLCTPINDNSIVKQTLDCFWWEVSNIWVEKFFAEQTCRKLILTKLKINKQVAYDILKLNKHQVRNDEKKLFAQNERSKYDKLLDIIMINIWYIERIWKKWPSKTKNWN